MQVSIVIPVHNEEGNIVPLLQEIRQALTGRHQYEVICVDDHSSDRTPARLGRHGAEYSELRIVRLHRQCGQSAALRVGVREARFPLVVTMDGDGQNDPADIDRFLQFFSGQDICLARQLVIGHRQKRQDTGWRRFSSRLANAVRRLLLRDGAPDSGCGIKAFQRATIFLTVRIGKMLWPEDKDTTGMLPFFLLGMLFWSMYATLTMFDVLVTSLCLTAYLGFLRARQGRGARPWLLVALAVGLGLLGKGPVVLLYILPPALLAPWWSRGQRGSWPRWYACLALALAGGIILALGWAVPAARAGGPEYGHAILLGQTAGRLLRSFAHDRPFFWYALWLPPLLFPWIFWGTVWRGGRQMVIAGGARFCLSAIIPSFLLLSCISGKQVHYLLPLLPAVALLLAKAAGAGAGTAAADFRPLAALLFLAGVVLLILPRLQLHGGDAKMLTFLPPWLGVIPLLAGLVFLVPASGSVPRAVTRIAVSNVVLLIILHLALSSPLRRLYDQAETGAALRSAEESGAVIAAFPARLKDQFQFAGRLRRPLLPMDSLEEVAYWAEENPGQYCLFVTTQEGRAWLQGSGISHRFKDGWLVVRPAKGLYADYRQWKSATGEPTVSAETGIHAVTAPGHAGVPWKTLSEVGGPFPYISIRVMTPCMRSGGSL